MGRDRAMIRKTSTWIMLVAGVVIGLAASGRIGLRAQDGGATDLREPGRLAPPERAMGRDSDKGAATSPPPTVASVQDVLLRPFRFAFHRPTTLAQVCVHLKESLGVPVVLDIAALQRQDVDPDDTVQLELDGVRLKTGLKLLLDQVGLTYHVVPEDNLLILTDREGSDDPLDRIWNELRTLHRDLHDVQDAVDDLTDSLYGEKEEGARVRKPTIIEEKSDRDPVAPEPAEGARKTPRDPGQKPGATQEPSSPPRSTPSRVPLTGPRRSL